MATHWPWHGWHPCCHPLGHWLVCLRMTSLPIFLRALPDTTRERPIPMKHVAEWDIRLVLAYFQSDQFRHWGTLSDRDLTLKTVFLLALASGKRRSELHALTPRVQWSQGANNGMEHRQSLLARHTYRPQMAWACCSRSLSQHWTK